MKTSTAPLAERHSSPPEKARRLHPGLLLILALILLAAGCAPISAAGSWAGIGLAPDGLIIANTDHVTRLNDVGVARWEFPSSGDRDPMKQFYATPAVTEDVVYVGGYDHKVYALNRDNGQVIWINEDSPSRIIGGLVVAQGKVLVGRGDHGLMALNQLTGEQVWMAETGQGVWARPLVVGDVVYITSLDKHIYALNLATGAELWRQDLKGAIAGTPAYGDGVLYVGTFSQEVYALNATDGSVLATFAAGNWVWGGPALADGVLYVGDMDGNLFALQAPMLTPIWQRQVAREAIRSTPLVVGDLVVVGSRDDNVYAVNRTNGTPVWQQTAGGDVLGSLHLLNDELIVVTTLDPERQIVTYTLEGQQNWVYPAVASQ